MDNIIQESTRKHAEQVRQQAIDFIEKKKEAPAMQVTYNGFTGELVKLETKMVDGLFYTSANASLVIYDKEKQVTHSFTDVKLEDVKFLGGAVSSVNKPKIPYRFQPEHIRAMERVMNRYGDTASAVPCKDGEIKNVRNRKELVKLEPEDDGSEC